MMVVTCFFSNMPEVSFIREIRMSRLHVMVGPRFNSVEFTYVHKKGEHSSILVLASTSIAERDDSLIAIHPDNLKKFTNG